MYRKIPSGGYLCYDNDKVCDLKDIIPSHIHKLKINTMDPGDILTIRILNNNVIFTGYDHIEDLTFYAEYTIIKTKLPIEIIRSIASKSQYMYYPANVPVEDIDLTKVLGVTITKPGQYSEINLSNIRVTIHPKNLKTLINILNKLPDDCTNICIDNNPIYYRTNNNNKIIKLLNNKLNQFNKLIRLEIWLCYRYRDDIELYNPNLTTLKTNMTVNIDQILKQNVIENLYLTMQCIEMKSLVENTSLLKLSEPDFPNKDEILTRNRQLLLSDMKTVY